jgi:hypothetical protein
MWHGELKGVETMSNDICNLPGFQTGGSVVPPQRKVLDVTYCLYTFKKIQVNVHGKRGSKEGVFIVPSVVR